MITYNFEAFTDEYGEKGLTVFTQGKICKTAEEFLSTPKNKRAKELFKIYDSDTLAMSKEEFINGYIYFQSGIEGPETENIYNQITAF